MTRTRLRQVEQINNTSLYSDILHQGTNTGTATEGQPLDTIATGIVCNISGTTVTINSNDLTSLGVNVEDIIEVGSEQIDISNISVVSGNTTITLVSAPSAQSSQTITIKVNPVKSLDRDLNHVRTQLKKLNHANHWWNNPTMNGVSMFSSQTRTAIFAGELIDVGGIYNAGDPFDLNIYLNGELIQASIRSVFSSQVGLLPSGH